MTMTQVPFFTVDYINQQYGDEIRDEIDRIICSGNFILGNEVSDLEDNICRYVNAKYAVGVSSGTDALFLGLQALDLPENSEVITSPFTFFASASCIVRNNLKPVFVDVDEYTYNIDVDKIEDYITDATSCILPVDLFSHTPNYDKIHMIAADYDLKVLEDSAEAFGMKWKDQYAGTLGDVGVFSFFPTKTLGCFGDGGMVITNDEAVAVTIKRLRNHGCVDKYQFQNVGINARLDSIQAAVLNVRLRYIDDEIMRRNEIAGYYLTKLVDIDEITLPVSIPETRTVWYVLSILCKQRDELRAYLQENGVATQIYYQRPLHLQDCFKELGYKAGDFPVAEKLCASALALPIYPGMTYEAVDYICYVIKKFYAGK